MDYRTRIKIARRLVRIAKEIIALEFDNMEDYRNYPHEIRDTTDVYIDGKLVQKGVDESLDADTEKFFVRNESGNFELIDDGKEPPDYHRYTFEERKHYVKDGVSDLSPEENAKWEKQCVEDVEKTNPGIAEKAAHEYNSFNAIEKDVLKAYTLRDWYDLNKGHYRVSIGQQEKLKGEQLYESIRLHRVLKKLPKYNGTVYRGMNFPDDMSLNNFKKSWKKGNSPLTGFVSTTYNPENYGLYLDEEQKHCVIRIVNSTQGHYIGHLSHTPRDEEVLFDCNQRFMLIDGNDKSGYSPIEEKNDVTIITVRETN